MKTFFGIALFFTIPLAQAQSIVYLNDQTKVAGELIELTPEKVSLKVPKGSSTVKFSYGADRVVATVSRYGRLLCMNYLLTQTDDERARLISEFMADTSRPAQDIIIRLSPLEAIYGEVSYDQGEVVNYSTPFDGTLASLPKTKVAAIFYRNGKHEFFTDALVLCDNPDLLRDRSRSQSGTPPVAVAEPKPSSPVAASVATATSSPAVVHPGVTEVLKLTAQEYEEYRSQGLQRVQQFGVLLGIVADKAADANQKAKAVSQILQMFKPDATIEVSSSVPGAQSASYSLRDYLKRLKLLPYKSITLEWSDIQYVNELTQKPDGNYYGKIRGEQRFSGLNSKGGLQYGDVTQKEVDIMLTPYQKDIEGNEKGKWWVILGNVGVVATQ